MPREPRRPRAPDLAPANEFAAILLKAFGPDAAAVRLPEPRWSPRGKVYGAPLALRRLWQECGLRRAVLVAAEGNYQLAEHVFRTVVCAVCDPGMLGQAHRWSWGFLWPGGESTSSRDIKEALRLLERAKDYLEESLFLHGRDLFNVAIEQGFLVAASSVVVLFREGARPVAFEWVDGLGRQGANDKLVRRFAPLATRAVEGDQFAVGLHEVFDMAGEDRAHGELRGGVAVAAFLALVLLAELRRRLPEAVSTTEALRQLGELRALEVVLGQRRYLVRQKLSGPARVALRSLGVPMPRRIVQIA